MNERRSLLGMSTVHLDLKSMLIDVVNGKEKLPEPELKDSQDYIYS